MPKSISIVVWWEYFCLPKRSIRIANKRIRPKCSTIQTTRNRIKWIAILIISSWAHAQCMFPVIVIVIWWWRRRWRWLYTSINLILTVLQKSQIVWLAVCLKYYMPLLCAQSLHGFFFLPTFILNPSRCLHFIIFHRVTCSIIVHRYNIQHQNKCHTCVFSFRWALDGCWVRKYYNAETLKGDAFNQIYIQIPCYNKTVKR